MTERVTVGRNVTWRNYIMADGQMVALRVIETGLNPTMFYPLLDHLGSMAALVDGNQLNQDGSPNPNYGNVIDRYSYDAFGMARDPNAWKPLDCTKGPQTPFTRGFTGQEHLPDNVCLINFNARLYDPQIGRFMSADPTVESVYDGQDLNRYTYVGNNPLAFTDASGLCFMGCFYRSPIVGAALDVGLFFFGLPELEVLTNLASVTGTSALAVVATNTVNAGIAGGLSGAVTSGRLKGALMSAAQGAATAGFAPDIANAVNTVIANPIASTFIAHGFVGGLFNIGHRGGFASGFLAAGVGSLPAPIPLGEYVNGIEMAALGGAASVLGGGKFANGAATAAMSYLAEGYASGAFASADQSAEQATTVSDPSDLSSTERQAKFEAALAFERQHDEDVSQDSKFEFANVFRAGIISGEDTIGDVSPDFKTMQALKAWMKMQKLRIGNSWVGVHELASIRARYMREG